MTRSEAREIAMDHLIWARSHGYTAAEVSRSVNRAARSRCSWDQALTALTMAYMTMMNGAIAEAAE